MGLSRLVLCRFYTSNASTMLRTKIVAQELLKKRVQDLNSEGNSYLFNCGEGTQRLSYSTRTKLSNLSHLFTTSLDWNRVSGSIGVSLTLEAIGVPALTLHSTSGIEDLFNSTKSFVQHYSGMKCSAISHKDGDEYQDSGIHIQIVSLDDCESISDASSTKRFKKEARLLAYICTLPDLPGPLDPKKCRELNVPIGRQLATLKSGCDIQLSDGTIVRSTDVCGPKNQGTRFIVLECPKPETISLLTDNARLGKLQTMRSSEGEHQVDMVIHFSPKSVIELPEYQNWMDKFAGDCKHLLIHHDDNRRLNFIDSYRSQYLLGKLDKVLFPDLYLPEALRSMIEQEIKDNRNSQQLEYGLPGTDETELRHVLKGNLDEQSRVMRVQPSDRITLRPKRTLESQDNKMVVDILFRAANFDSEFKRCLEEYRSKQEQCPLPLANEPEVIFLGTGSAIPSKLRNTSFIVVNFQAPKDVSIILDCGEDSYGQLIRFYGPEKTAAFLKRLKMIYVSHHHADHHIGLITLLKRRQEVTDEKIILLLPPGVETLLNYHNKNFQDLSQTYTIYSTKNLKTNPKLAKRDDTPDYLKSELYNRLPGFLSQIDIIDVEHCFNSCAAVMKFKIDESESNIFTLAYSGDAMPSDEFATLASDCDLLIHEATFDHREKQDALDKKHSTTSDAIAIGKKSKAKFTILTHFSAKFPKIPYFTEEFDDKVGFAFDNMSVRCPSGFPRIPIMKDILSLVYGKSLNEIDERHFKLEVRQKLIKEKLQTTRLSGSS